MYKIEPLIELSKEYIYTKISQETLMEHYLGIRVKKGLFKSPLRSDTKPTCAFYKSPKGELLFKDFRGDFCGGAINIVMHKYNCSYTKALSIIGNDFNLIPNAVPINLPLIEYSGTTFKDTFVANIQIELQDFQDSELLYWNQYGISVDILKKYKVYSCKNVFLNSKLFHLNKSNQLVFGYYGGKKNNLEQWRIYFPVNKKYRFLSNWKMEQLQGSHMLQHLPKDYLIVTKSLKDVMVLYKYKLASVAPISENCFLTEEQYNIYKEKYKKIIVFYDNDLAGINNMQKIRKKFPEVIVRYIPRFYKVKDISDFYKKYGDEKTLSLIENGKNSI